MPPGKLASQVGHAYLEAFLRAGPERQSAYRAGGMGVKVCLGAPGLNALGRLYDRALALGLPCYLVEDSGRNTTFGGVPTVSALGVGPLTAGEAAFLRRLPLLP